MATTTTAPPGGALEATPMSDEAREYAPEIEHVDQVGREQLLEAALDMLERFRDGDGPSDEDLVELLSRAGR